VRRAAAPDPASEIATMRHGLTRRALLGTAAATLAIGAARAALPTSAEVVGELSYYVTDGERTLLDVAREHGLGILDVSAANPGVDVWIPGREQLITLPTAHVLPDAPHEGIVINLAELRLYHFPSGGGPVETYTIGIGREGFDTPRGTTRVARKQEKPTWYPTEGKRRDDPTLPAVVPPGPDNPLGDYAIYLGWPTYIIHGTNKPYGVGRRVSRGCIRMYPEGVAALFPRVKVGTRVTVVEQPIKLGWLDGELYLEAHPDLEQLEELESSYSFRLRPAPDMTAAILAKAGAAAWRIDWAVVDAELVARRGLPVRITGEDRVVADVDPQPPPPPEPDLYPRGRGPDPGELPPPERDLHLNDPQPSERLGLALDELAPERVPLDARAMRPTPRGLY
jgi:L,D-transpeptidase ErfK/SrfK